MNNIMKETLAKCIDLLEQIRSDFPWQISYMHQFAALAYGSTGKSYDKERLLRIKQVVFSSAGFFSTFRSQWFFTAVILDNYYDNPEEAFRKMQSSYQTMKQEKVLPYNYAIITAHIIARRSDVGYERDLILKTREVYQGMKRFHPFLTSSEDYPLAALLATSKAGTGESAENIEACYRSLNGMGLPKGNGIQFLSHILCLSDESADSKCSRAVEIYNELGRNHLHLYSTYYGALGILTLLNKGTGEIIETVGEIVEEFRHTRHFKWLGKGMHVLFASMIMAKGIEDGASVAITGVTIEVILQAQTAAMVAASCAATAAAVSSTS